MNTYCHSKYQTKRNLTRVVKVGNVEIGGNNPIRLQSMTTTPTQDVGATVKQAIALAEAGCEIVRITAQNLAAAQSLKEIRSELRRAKVNVPLVADIHFLPKAALEAVEHVEKVRINPGNYADKKKFAILEYTDAEYEEELERLHEAFSPLVLRAKTLEKAIRIGTNHGSLSDRIINRYGDTPLGMVESALEFIRIAASHGFEDIILSMKASNPKVMIQAYRLAVAKMKAEGMHYPLHLGVTEAGDGEDARIKSAIGIGSLLADGIGDTIRVSLTEDPIYEIPVARDLANIAHKLWEHGDANSKTKNNKVNLFEYERRQFGLIQLTEELEVSRNTPPPAIIRYSKPLAEYEGFVKEILQYKQMLPNNPIECLLVSIKSTKDIGYFKKLQRILAESVTSYALDLADGISVQDIKQLKLEESKGYIFCKRFKQGKAELLKDFSDFVEAGENILAVDCTEGLVDGLDQVNPNCLIVTATQPKEGHHAVGTYRALAQELNERNISCPIWVRATSKNMVKEGNYFTSKLLEASVLAGSLFCDGIADVLSIETVKDLARSIKLTYNILQGARMRLSKTEFVACPSCGRTLFDLETTTQAVREKTGHLKGVTIAIMGCIVNGPGEMSDADFGYVGGSPEKINLYVGKECVGYNIPQEQAVDRLIELIKENGKWVDACEAKKD